MSRTLHADALRRQVDRAHDSRAERIALRIWSLVPTLALAAMFSLAVRIKVVKGFWPFHPLTGPQPSALPPTFEFGSHLVATSLAVVLGLAAAATMPIAVWALSRARGTRTYVLNLACLATSALLLYAVFGNPRGWSAWFFD